MENPLKKNRNEELRLNKFEESEWQKLYNGNQKSYIRKRLDTVKYLQEEMPRSEVAFKLGVSRSSIDKWIDTYNKGGLSGLIKIKRSINRKQRLSLQQKEELVNMILKERPEDYGIDRHIWTGKILEEVIKTKWGVILKDSRIYNILEELGLSHQKAHRDYENADPEAQKAFVAELKKK